MRALGGIVKTAPIKLHTPKRTQTFSQGYADMPAIWKTKHKTKHARSLQTEPSQGNQVSAEKTGTDTFFYLNSVIDYPFNFNLHQQMYDRLRLCLRVYSVVSVGHCACWRWPLCSVGICCQVVSICTPAFLSVVFFPPMHSLSLASTCSRC